LAKNANLTVEVYAKIRSTVTATHDIRSVMTVTGTTANSGQSATTGAINGQLIAAGNASVSVSLDPSSPVNMITVGNSTKAVGAYKFNAVNDAITVSEMVISFVNASNIATVNLKDGDTDAVILSKPGASTVTFSGLSIAVANNASKVVTVELVLGTVGTGAGTSGANVKATLDSYKYRPASTGAETPATPALDTNNMYVFKAIPTITSATLPTTILAEGNNTLSKFTVAADTNPIYWKKMIFTVATSSTGFQVSGFKLYEGSTEIAGTFSVSGSAVSFLATNEQSVSGSGEKTYSLKGSASSVATNDSVSTYIDASAAVAVTQQTAYAATTTAATFVWSDGSANAHGLGTSDWYDDYLVKNIPLDAQGLSK